MSGFLTFDYLCCSGIGDYEFSYGPSISNFCVPARIFDKGQDFYQVTCGHCYYIWMSTVYPLDGPDNIMISDCPNCKKENAWKKELVQQF